MLHKAFKRTVRLTEERDGVIFKLDISEGAVAIVDSLLGLRDLTEDSLAVHV